MPTITYQKKDLPVLLLTGYLGSGKTTLVNKILANKKGIKFAVIVNDIGEVNIDASLIEKGGVVGKKNDSLVALQNGCICCTLKMDLVQQLHDIASMRKFDYIVIEASGICEPAPIAQTIASFDKIDPIYNEDINVHLDCIVTVVDSLRMVDEFQSGKDLQKKDIKDDDLENLVIQQIEFCNIILLNKTSEVKSEEMGRMKAIIRTIQPEAEMLECNYGDIDLDKIINTKKFNFEKVSMSPLWIKELEEHEDEMGKNAEESEEELEYGIGTFVYYRRRPFNLKKFDDFVSDNWPKSIIRTKGLCYFSNEMEMCYVFEQAGVQKTISQGGQWYATMPEEELIRFMHQNPDMMKDWDEHYGDRMQKIVFIGQNLDKEAITKGLDACLM
ncbi:MAG: GTP-binding protein [Phocaeicola sp.]|uniref:GTP-binding protein n=1 Tax=Phocaeicola sp. TaxID=2773926 RepID=UPI003FA0EFAB